MIVLIINGAPCSGKDTFMKFLTTDFKGPFNKLSSIAWANDIMIRHFGWDGYTKNENYRNTAAQLKQLGINFGNVPHKVMCKRIAHELDEGHCRVFVTDIREPSEMQKMIDFCKTLQVRCYTVLIANDEAEKAAEQLSLNKLGDCSYNEWFYHFTLNNNGTKDEFRKVIKDMFGPLLEPVLKDPRNIVKHIPKKGEHNLFALKEADQVSFLCNFTNVLLAKFINHPINDESKNEIKEYIAEHLSGAYSNIKFADTSRSDITCRLCIHFHKGIIDANKNMFIIDFQI